MAAKAMTASGAKSATSRPKEFNFVWEGRDRAGKTLRGETRASGETIVVNTLRRQARSRDRTSFAVARPRFRMKLA